MGAEAGIGGPGKNSIIVDLNEKYAKWSGRVNAAAIVPLVIAGWIAYHELNPSMSKAPQTYRAAIETVQELKELRNGSVFYENTNHVSMYDPSNTIPFMSEIASPRWRATLDSAITSMEEDITVMKKENPEVILYENERNSKAVLTWRLMLGTFGAVFGYHLIAGIKKRVELRNLTERFH